MALQRVRRDQVEQGRDEPSEAAEVWEPPASAGIGRARRRLTDRETERRMLETAASALARTGPTVSGPRHEVEGLWPLAAVGATDIVLGHVEPDPEVAWDDSTLEALRDRLRHEGDLLADEDSPLR